MILKFVFAIGKYFPQSWKLKKLIFTLLSEVNN